MRHVNKSIEPTAAQNVPLAEAGLDHWDADPNDPNLPLMSISLNYKDSKVASFAPSKPQVWVGAWNPIMGTWDPAKANANAADLHARATVTFPNAGIFNAFRNTVAGDPAWAFDQNTSTAVMTYRGYGPKLK